MYTRFSFLMYTRFWYTPENPLLLYLVPRGDPARNQWINRADMFWPFFPYGLKFPISIRSHYYIDNNIIREIIMTSQNVWYASALVHFLPQHSVVRMSDLRWSWANLGDLRWFWVILGDLGWSWMILGDFGWPWVNLGDLWWSWLIMGDLGWSWGT